MRALAVVIGAALAAGSLSAQPASLAFVHVSVVPMDREAILRDHTVVVRGDRIVAIGPSAEVKAPAGAVVVDGTGRFLMPGLAEMHGHLTGGNDALNERILLLNVAKGITTLRGMLGHPSHLVLRERVRKGELLGPTIYTSGPSLNGTTVPDASAAERLVAEQKAAGYDFLKIHPGILRGPFDALAAAAGKAGIGFAGHVPIDVGLHRALEARYRSIDHLDGYVDALLKEGAPIDPKQPGFFGFNYVGHLDESKLAALVAKTKAAGVWNVPTQSLIPAFLGPEPTAALAARPEMKYLPKATVDGWVTQREKLRATPIPAAQYTEFLAIRGRIIKALDAADAGVLLGADTPQVMQVPGFATHGELRALVASGLTPYRALRTGTVNVARYFGTEATTGTVANGMEASLILVDANPLDDVANAMKVSGVVVRGRWLPKAEIDAKLAALPSM